MTDEERPGERTTATRANVRGTTTDPASLEVAREMRRRREAAYRCSPLEDGLRDPLDRPRGIKFSPGKWDQRGAA